MPTLYRKKPVSVYAVQIPPEGEESEDFVSFFGKDDEIESNPDGSVNVHTLEGVMMGRPGDWIIRGVSGEIYPCKAAIFEATYESV